MRITGLSVVDLTNPFLFKNIKAEAQSASEMRLRPEIGSQVSISSLMMFVKELGTWQDYYMLLQNF